MSVQYNQYVDSMLMNKGIESEENGLMGGGGKKRRGGGEMESVPTGCCPPIFYCDVEEINLVKDDTVKVKGTAQIAHKASLSIKDIMTVRRNDKPFISL